MKTIKLANDLKITLVKEEKEIWFIKIDNPNWNWMMKKLGGSGCVQFRKNDIKFTNEKFFRDFIAKTYNENKQFILKEKMDNFRAY